MTIPFYGIVLIATALVFGGALIWMVVSFLTAPAGYEDDVTGFNYGERPEAQIPVTGKDQR